MPDQFTVRAGVLPTNSHMSPVGAAAVEAWDAGDHTALEAHLVEVATEIPAEAEWEAE